ncbi:MAG: hypothetical protein ACP5FH_09870, partial [Terracidiphilus sp.]
PTREYQTDQSSLKPAPAAAGSVLDQRQKQRQRQKQQHDCAGVDRSLHISTDQQITGNRRKDDCARIGISLAAFDERKERAERIAAHENKPCLAPCLRVGLWQKPGK